MSDTHKEVHEQHNKELANLIEMQREDLRHDCGASAYDQRIGALIEDAIASVLVWALQHARPELVEDFMRYAWERARS